MSQNSPSPRTEVAPFNRTHHRKSDGLEAMLLGRHDGMALYRVQWRESGKVHRNTLARPAATFDRDYLPAF